MAPRRDWLDRFRPAGSPGSPARPGVPADVSERDRELTAIFDTLEPASRQCARIRAEADREAARRRDAAAAAAAEVLANAEAQVPQARAEAFARLAAQSRARHERQAAELAAVELRDAGQARMPAAVAAVRGELLAQLTLLTGLDFTAPAHDLSGAER